MGQKEPKLKNQRFVESNRQKNAQKSTLCIILVTQVSMTPPPHLPFWCALPSSWASFSSPSFTPLSGEVRRGRGARRGAPSTAQTPPPPSTPTGRASTLSTEEGGRTSTSCSTADRGRNWARWRRPPTNSTDTLRGRQGRTTGNPPPLRTQNDVVVTNSEFIYH